MLSYLYWKKSKYNINISDTAVNGSLVYESLPATK